MIKKDWMGLPPYSEDYIKGVSYFLDIAFSIGIVEGPEILCPCAVCCNDSWEKREVVFNHLICNGFVKGYKEWIYHGDVESLMDLDDGIDGDASFDDIDGLLFERFKDVAEATGEHEGLNEDAKKFYKLVDDANQELYPGCKKFSTLSLSMIKDLGLDYKKIDACPNNCMLFWKERVKDDSCHLCGASRWIEYPEVECDLEESKKSHKVVAKVLRHLPLIPRLKRLFMCSKTADSLRWHAEERSRDGRLRHPTDGQAWKDFDAKHPNFSLETRNIKLGLANDGFNPFRTMNLSHSTWPMVLIVYNYPPNLCLKAENCMMSLLIPGPRSPGDAIDVYLQPLIEELKLLWDVGVETYDINFKESIISNACGSFVNC